MTKTALKLWSCIAVLCVCFAVSCRQSDSYNSIDGVIWNTTYHITYNSDLNLTDSVIATLRDVGRSVSAFDSMSVVSKINRNEDVALDTHFLKVFSKSVEINSITDGAFDPTISPLINAWGFGYAQAAADTLAVDSLLQFVGLSKCRIDGDRLVKEDSRTTFNFSAIAKGYGCDCVAEMFRRNGINDFLIEIGGEIVASGRSPKGRAWNVAVQAPSDNLRADAQIVVQFTDMAMATSGNYRNYRQENGRRIAHTIDPVTGRPKQTDVVSATIVASDCMQADAYATACMVMGGQDARYMIETQGIAAFLILDDGSTWSSTAFSKFTTK